MPLDRCHDCNTSLGTMTQETLPGVGVEKRCASCETKHQTKWMLAALPDASDREWEALSDWEAEFVTSVRAQFAAKGTVTEKQYQIVERIYEKTR